jgi:hypothetical protein
MSTQNEPKENPSKPNGGNVAAMPNEAPQAPPTVKCFVVPIDSMEVLRDAVREAPYKIAQQAIAHMSTFQVMDVPVNMPQIDD